MDEWDINTLEYLGTALGKITKTLETQTKINKKIFEIITKMHPEIELELKGWIKK